MNNLSQYIIEKLHLNKDVKINHNLDSNNFLYVTYDRSEDDIRSILWNRIECFETPENKNKEVIYIIYKEDKIKILDELDSYGIHSSYVSFHKIPKRYYDINSFIEDYTNNKTNIVGTKI